MLRYRRTRAEHRQCVDEAKHLHFQGFVLHGPDHHAIVPPATVENAGPLMAGALQNKPADFEGRRLDSRNVAR
jgi:hypothetical protein